MREQTYRIRVGTVAAKRDGWSWARQVPEFEVRATSPHDAARKARAVMLSAASSGDEAQAFFGMLDEDDNYFDEKAGES